MKIYHLTTDLNHTGNFDLRHSEYEDERDYDKLKKASNGRICFSSNLHGCIGSMSSITTDVEDGAEPVTLRVFELDTEVLNRGMLITPKELVESGVVWDAELHNEYWVLEQLFLPESSTFLITLNSLEFEYIRQDPNPLSPSTKVVTNLVLSDGEEVFELFNTEFNLDTLAKYHKMSVDHTY